MPALASPDPAVQTFLSPWHTRCLPPGAPPALWTRGLGHREVPMLPSPSGYQTRDLLPSLSSTVLAGRWVRISEVLVPASTVKGKVSFSLETLPCPVIRNTWSPDFGLILIRLRCRPEQSLETSTSTRNQLHERGEPLRAWKSLCSTSLGTWWPGQWAE